MRNELGLGLIIIGGVSIFAGFVAVTYDGLALLARIMADANQSTYQMIKRWLALYSVHRIGVILFSAGVILLVGGGLLVAPAK